jgi:hypothetical protein
MPDLRQPVLKAVLFAAHTEYVRNIGSGQPTGVSRRESELYAIIGPDGVDFVRNGFDQCDEESRSGDPIGFFLQLNKIECACPINRDIEMQLYFGSSTSAMSMWK